MRSSKSKHTTTKQLCSQNNFFKNLTYSNSIHSTNVVKNIRRVAGGNVSFTSIFLKNSKSTAGHIITNYCVIGYYIRNWFFFLKK